MDEKNCYVDFDGIKIYFVGLIYKNVQAVTGKAKVFVAHIEMRTQIDRVCSQVLGLTICTWEQEVEKAVGIVDSVTSIITHS